MKFFYSYWCCLVLVALGVATLVATVGCDSTSGAGGSEMDSFVTQMDQSKEAAARVAAAEQAKAAADAEKKAAVEAEAAKRAEEEQARLAAQQEAPEENETSITITVKNPEKLMQGAIAGAQEANRRRDKMGEGTVGKRTRRNSVQNGPLQYYGAISNARIVFEDRALGWQIQKSMDVYVNTHDGKYPKDTDEYMREIIEANMIELPELPENQEYFYDPEDHELKIGEIVEEPAEATEPVQK